jgi:hypothetical protein
MYFQNGSCFCFVAYLATLPATWGTEMSNDWIRENNELEGMWKNAVIA